MLRIKILFYICCLFSTVKLNATDVFTFNITNSSYKEGVSICKTYREDVKLYPFRNSKQIIGFAISGTLTKNSSD